jgi:hypothetical protein
LGTLTLGQILKAGLVNYLMKDNGTIHVENQLALETVQYGFDFVNYEFDGLDNNFCNNISGTCSYGMALIYSSILRRCIQHLSHLQPCSKPQIVGYILEYLVAFASVVRLDRSKERDSSHVKVQVEMRDECIIVTELGTMNRTHVILVSEVEKINRTIVNRAD